MGSFQIIFFLDYMIWRNREINRPKLPRPYQILHFLSGEAVHESDRGRLETSRLLDVSAKWTYLRKWAFVTI